MFVLFFRSHPEGTKFENQITYIPAEMAQLPKTKIGMSVGWQTKRGRVKASWYYNLRNVGPNAVKFKVIYLKGLWELVGIFIS